MQAVPISTSGAPCLFCQLPCNPSMMSLSNGPTSPVTHNHLSNIGKTFRISNWGVVLNRQPTTPGGSLLRSLPIFEADINLSPSASEATSVASPSPTPPHSRDASRGVPAAPEAEPGFSGDALAEAAAAAANQEPTAPIGQPSIQVSPHGVRSGTLSPFVLSKLVDIGFMSPIDLKEEERRVSVCLTSLQELQRELAEGNAVDAVDQLQTAAAAANTATGPEAPGETVVTGAADARAAVIAGTFSSRVRAAEADTGGATPQDAQLESAEPAAHASREPVAAGNATTDAAPPAPPSAGHGGIEELVAASKAVAEEAAQQLPGSRPAPDGAPDQALDKSRASAVRSSAMAAIDANDNSQSVGASSAAAGAWFPAGKATFGKSGTVAAPCLGASAAADSNPGMGEAAELETAAHEAVALKTVAGSPVTPGCSAGDGHGGSNLDPATEEQASTASSAAPPASSEGTPQDITPAQDSATVAEQPEKATGSAGPPVGTSAVAADGESDIGKDGSQGVRPHLAADVDSGSAAVPDQAPLPKQAQEPKQARLPKQAPRPEQVLDIAGEPKMDTAAFVAETPLPAAAPTHGLPEAADEILSRGSRCSLPDQGMMFVSEEQPEQAQRPDQAQEPNEAPKAVVHGQPVLDKASDAAEAPIQVAATAHTSDVSASEALSMGVPPVASGSADRGMAIVTKEQPEDASLDTQKLPVMVTGLEWNLDEASGERAATVVAVRPNTPELTESAMAASERLPSAKPGAAAVKAPMAAAAAKPEQLDMVAAGGLPGAAVLQPAVAAASVTLVAAASRRTAATLPEAAASEHLEAAVAAAAARNEALFSGRPADGVAAGQLHPGRAAAAGRSHAQAEGTSAIAQLAADVAEAAARNSAIMGDGQGDGALEAAVAAAAASNAAALRQPGRSAPHDEQTVSQKANGERGHSPLRKF